MKEKIFGSTVFGILFFSVYLRRNGHTYSSFVAEPKIFLPRLMNEVELLSGRFEKRSFRRLKDIGPEADIIVNCSGLGARTLVPDPTVYPIRGQVMRVRAPAVDFSVNDNSEESFCYVIPQ